MHDISHCARLHDLVAEAEARHRCGIESFQRGLETTGRKNELPESCHPQRDNRSYAGRSTPYIAAWATPDDCAAFGTNSGPPLRPPTKHAERRCPARSPTLANPQGLEEPAVG